jgi:hypothetical protein
VIVKDDDDRSDCDYDHNYDGNGDGEGEGYGDSDVAYFFLQVCFFLSPPQPLLLRGSLNRFMFF